MGEQSSILPSAKISGMGYYTYVFKDFHKTETIEKAQMCDITDQTGKTTMIIKMAEGRYASSIIHSAQYTWTYSD